MIIGTAVSRLVEEPGKAMKFDLAEMESDEAMSYLGLLDFQDDIGSLESLHTPRPLAPKPQKKPATKPSSASSARQQTSKIVAIEEIEDSDTDLSEDEDLIPYEKPDEDASDSDEDPTLVQRNKPMEPVYVLSSNITSNPSC